MNLIKRAARNIDSRTFLKDFFERLAPHGFNLHKIVPDGLGEAVEYSQSLENFSYQNWMAVRP